MSSKTKQKTKKNTPKNQPLTEVNMNLLGKKKIQAHLVSNSTVFHPVKLP